MEDSSEKLHDVSNIGQKLTAGCMVAMGIMATLITRPIFRPNLWRPFGVPTTLLLSTCNYIYNKS